MAIEERFVQLDSGRVQRNSDHKVARMMAEIPKDHTLEDCLQPHYFAHHARQFQAGRTIILAIWDDSSKIAELFVQQCGANFAIVRAKSYTDFDSAEVPAATGYVIEWISKEQKHGVLRAGDRSLMKAGFHSKVDAEKYAAELG